MPRLTVLFMLALCCRVFFLEPLAADEAKSVRPALPKDTLPAELPLDVIPLGLEPQRPAVQDNQLTTQRARLGRRLFFDPLLSADRTLACATCHDPAHGFASSAPKSAGLLGRIGTRNAPSLWNRAYGKLFFWDGRAASLEEQALRPIENDKELGAGVDEVLRRISADDSYRQQFAAAYEGGVTPANLAKALASFQRVLLSGDSRVDRFQANSDVAALSVSERSGLWLFESKARCWHCHSGRNYSDEALHNTGVGWGEGSDPGRMAVTKIPTDRGKFKTPTLRSVAQSPPYMHDGSLATLKEVVEFYDRGGGKNPQLDPLMQPLNLSPREVDDLVAFLKALDGVPLWEGKRK
jgi:cytochrome c peroxidase